MGSTLSLAPSGSLTSFEDLRKFILETKERMNLVFDIFTIEVLGSDHWIALTGSSKFLFNLVRFLWRFPIFFRLEFTPRAEALGFPVSHPSTVLLDARSFCRLSNHLELLAQLLSTGSSISCLKEVEDLGLEENKNNEREEKEEEEKEEKIRALPLATEEECHICMENRCNLVLSCSHTMCTQCFNEWRERGLGGPSGSCPDCRREFEENEEDTLFTLTTWASEDVRESVGKLEVEIGDILRGGLATLPSLPDRSFRFLQESTTTTTDQTWHVLPLFPVEGRRGDEVTVGGEEMVLVGDSESRDEG